MTDNANLAEYNQSIVTFSLKAEYHIENEVAMEFDFIETLLEERENAERQYREFKVD